MNTSLDALDQALVDQFSDEFLSVMPRDMSGGLTGSEESLAKVAAEAGDTTPASDALDGESALMEVALSAADTRLSPPVKVASPLQTVPKKVKIPRPPNAFILFRMDKQPSIVQEHMVGECSHKPTCAPAKTAGSTAKVCANRVITINNNQVSKIIGKMWQSASPDVKRTYRLKAEEAKREHKEKYPDYKYSPKKPADKKKRGRNAPGSTASVLASAFQSDEALVLSDGLSEFGFDEDLFPLHDTTTSVPKRRKIASPSLTLSTQLDSQVFANWIPVSTQGVFSTQNIQTALPYPSYVSQGLSLPLQSFQMIHALDLFADQPFRPDDNLSKVINGLQFDSMASGVQWKPFNRENTTHTISESPP
jgi:hypothetical protein